LFAADIGLLKTQQAASIARCDRLEERQNKYEASAAALEQIVIANSWIAEPQCEQVLNR